MKKNDIGADAIILHKKLGGKIRIESAMKVMSRAELSLIYTPGVAAVSSLLAHPSTSSGQAKLARDYTIKGKMIAVVSDGSAVLGLGNIGPYGALPVMEGKCALFKTFAGVDAFPIVLDTTSPRLRSASTQERMDFIVETICAIAPAFGGINLEDIAAPHCFYIEEELKRRLDIPVMHDDQHGTAVVILAALINAARVVKKDIKKLRVVVSGAGAAGSASTSLLLKAGIKDIVVLDRKGVLDRSRTEPHKKALAAKTNPRRVHGGLREALAGADVLLGVSGPGLATAADIALMAPRSIVFAMANPTPEIMPQEAKRGGAVVVGTGRSDYPNQINNSLAFPGIFRGALETQVRQITDAMKIQAAKNLAALVKRPNAERVVPGPFDPGVSAAVAKAIQ
ncbi:malate dehydrogenase [Candidatus Adlerbacteria bacterium RIFCSPHIGHO2_02_FULL_54_18]|uniref:Malate dehydrogenase n=2 Tax=Candidatus Adleribacteriota TaxID=1752736 RepID=A0A1F4Y4P3_9BACT|nr:MAG: malate dehydrogenase [Candidatus Adlerbacteria bacterium RIFCSPLOWO2_01_FULL_54_21b]OGC88912.1 MAG: malate dehydrogenase [Candidatus Adlerbacteria bacterium RIFCSPHIGHO2_02_FULL_54_18]OGJ55675.1 MAG: malate dehydrogenase [Candidatus Peribacteria bacterium RIFCSPHIGHO2_01_FULL_51_35]